MLRDSLRASLTYEPEPLKFGTSGRRGEVVHLTQLEIYINVIAELEYLQSLAPAEGGIVRGEEFYFAYDLRPSSSRFVPEQQGRGEIAQAVERAIIDAGQIPENLGRIPTPALTLHALQRRKGSIMITGSHIPFERNGYKTNTSRGELLKKDEAPINLRVEQVRRRIYDQPSCESIFDAGGLFKSGHRDLLEELPDGRERYVQRYIRFFGGEGLAGKRLLVYQHSAVGRDILVEILQRLGAEVIPTGRSDAFVPIDTENIEENQLGTMQALADQAWGENGPLDAIVSTDGDSDRPLLLSVEPGAGGNTEPRCRVKFHGGDLVGMIVAQFLGADAVVVPISCNDAVDRSPLGRVLEPKTRIGSPYVIAGMERARQKGRKVICGWEANGGFLTGSDIERGGRILEALPTRDAMLPILGVLYSMVEQGGALSSVFERLPRRFSRAALVRGVPRSKSQNIIRRFSPEDERVTEVVFPDRGMCTLDEERREFPSGDSTSMLEKRDRLSVYFSRAVGFDEIERLNYTDGLRIYFKNGEVAHIRPSGNADELRIYAVADSQARADAIAAAGVAEPDGILRRLERDASEKQLSSPATDPAADACAWLRAHPGVHRLTGFVQHYAWGGFELIPSLLGIDNGERRPFAELWIGSHPRGSASLLFNGRSIPLSRLLETAAVEIQGKEAVCEFGNQMPFLMKVLDARKMLSIQAHPTRQQAEAGYASEEAAGIPIGAPERNYRDRNHKPEVQVALTDLWMLHGFRPAEEIARTLQTTPEFRNVMPAFSDRLNNAGNNPAARIGLIRDLYGTVTRMSQAAADAILDPLIRRLEKAGVSGKSDPGYWALLAARDFPLPSGSRDKGIFSLYLLKLIHLRPGEGTYQPAGTLHAYLEGANVELMANSDNVLRGGLTPKHVDAKELMQIVDFSSGMPSILNGEIVSSMERVYRTPASEFELSSIRLEAGNRHERRSARGAEVGIVLNGDITVCSDSESSVLGRGGIFMAPHGIHYVLEGKGEGALIYRASLPSGRHPTDNQ